MFWASISVQESTSPEAQKGGQNLKLPATGMPFIYVPKFMFTFQSPKHPNDEYLVNATGSYSIARPSEDADSRTIFISNVSFFKT